MTWQNPSRRLLALSFMLTPLLAGAKGGCSDNGPISIGGDSNKAGAASAGASGPGVGTAGESSTGGSAGGQGVACGRVTCGSGQTCCNASCGVCAAPGQVCDQRACDPCTPQDATADGSCRAFLGWKRTATSCEPLSGCSCSGAACDELFQSQEECTQSLQDCGGSCNGPKQAVLDYVAAHKTCRTDADCKIAYVSCVPGVDCTGANYVNTAVDQKVLDVLGSTVTQCAGEACPVCPAIPSPAACVEGTCQPQSVCAAELAGDQSGSKCQQGCTLLMASWYDPEKKCRNPMEGVGCSVSAVGTADLSCVKRPSDGALFFGNSSSMFAQAGWLTCSEAEASAVNSAPACP